MNKDEMSEYERLMKVAEGDEQLYLIYDKWYQDNGYSGGIDKWWQTDDFKFGYEAFKFATEKQIKRDAEICAKKGKEYEQEWIKQKSICDTNLEGLGDGADECAYLILSQLKDKSNDH